MNELHYRTSWTSLELLDADLKSGNSTASMLLYVAAVLTLVSLRDLKLFEAM